MRLILEFREEPRSDLLLLWGRELRDFRERLFEKCGHNFTAENSTLSDQPNDIEFSGEKEGARATDAESAAMRC
ncbi:MAG: hypothetical protein WCC53_02205 [Thermoanaerobaculia bacterium]